MRVLQPSVANGQPFLNTYDFQVDDLYLDVPCAGNSAATAAGIFTALNAASIIVRARYVDANNFCIMLPGSGNGQTVFPVPVKIIPAWMGPGAAPVGVNITVFTPNNTGLSDQFFDGTTSLSIPLGKETTFRLCGSNEQLPLINYWSHT